VSATAPSRRRRATISPVAIADRRRLGRRVRELREQRGMNQEDLGARVNLDRRHIGRIENGEANLTLDLLRRVAKALGVSRAEFFPSD